jgi:hypothetical protein
MHVYSEAPTRDISIVIGTSDGFIKVISFLTMKVEKSIKIHKSQVNFLAIFRSPSSAAIPAQNLINILLSISDDR